MTLVFMDGFDHLDGTAAYATKWTQAYSMVDGNFASNTGRRSSGGVFIGNGASSCLRKVITGIDEIYIGAAIKPTTDQTGDVLMELMNGLSTVHISLNYNGGSGLKVYRGASATLLGTGSINVTTGTWYYIELYAKISDTVGVVKVRVDGVLDIDLSSQDTQTGASTTVDMIVLGSWSTSSATRSLYADDLYVCNASGSVNNGFLGDCIIDTIYPTAAGDSTQWTPSTGSNYAAVDEARSTTSDTDYVSTATNGYRDLYTFGDITERADPDVHAVGINLFARKVFSGDADTLSASVKLSGTTEDMTAVSLTNSLVVKQFIVEDDPAAAAWTQTNVNSAQFGFKDVV